MAIRNVVTRGVGAGASIPFVVTRGYSIGAAVSIDAPGLHWRITGSPLHYVSGGSRLEYRPPGTPLHYLDDDP